MGLYDTVLLEEGVELPKFDKDVTSISWQTKDLENLMTTFKITEEGRLLKKEEEYEETTKEKREKEAKKEGYDSWEEYVDENPLLSFSKSIEKESEEWIDYGQHGSFEFYKNIQENGDKVSYRYEARFTNGYLDKIILLSKKQR